MMYMYMNNGDIVCVCVPSALKEVHQYVYAVRDNVCVMYMYIYMNVGDIVCVCVHSALREVHMYMQLCICSS